MNLPTARRADFTSPYGVTTVAFFGWCDVNGTPDDQGGYASVRFPDETATTTVPRDSVRPF